MTKVPKNNLQPRKLPHPLLPNKISLLRKRQLFRKSRNLTKRKSPTMITRHLTHPRERLSLHHLLPSKSRHNQLRRSQRRESQVKRKRVKRRNSPRKPRISQHQSQKRKKMRMMEIEVTLKRGRIKIKKNAISSSSLMQATQRMMAALPNSLRKASHLRSWSRCMATSLRESRNLPSTRRTDRWQST